MSSDDLRRSVMAALARIKHPGSGRDLIAGGHVQNLEVDDEGNARFQFLLQPQAAAAVAGGRGAAFSPVPFRLPRLSRVCSATSVG